MLSTAAVLWKRFADKLTATDAYVITPERLLEQAQEEMRGIHAKNHDRIVRSIAEKNLLQQKVDAAQITIGLLQNKADTARENHNSELAQEFLKEKQDYEAALRTTLAELEEAVVAQEKLRAAIKREDEKIRQKTADALAFKAQWKNTRIQAAMNAALGNIDADTQRIDKMVRKLENARERVELVHTMNTLMKLTAHGLETLREKAASAQESGDSETGDDFLRQLKQGEAAYAHLCAAKERSRTVPLNAPPDADTTGEQG